jgi:homoserine kinase type II
MDFDIKKELPKRYQNSQITKPKDGSSSRVYYLDERLVLRVLQKEQADFEQSVTKIALKAQLKVPKIVDSFELGNLRILIFEKVVGCSPEKPSQKELKAICDFANSLHKVEPTQIAIKRDIFSRQKLENLLNKHKIYTIKDELKSVKCNPNQKHFIHGDLFIDNCKFQNQILMGVYDFEFASMGDRAFEFAVVAISWCKKRDGLSKECLGILLEYLNIDFWEFLEYIKYALLFYATIRYTNGRDYQNLLKFYNSLKEIRW